MEPHDEPIDYEYLSRGATGSHDAIDAYRIIVYPFGKYEILLKLTSDGRLVDVLEVRINKEFLAHRQESLPDGFHDVDEFYRE